MSSPTNWGAMFSSPGSRVVSRTSKAPAPTGADRVAADQRKEAEKRLRKQQKKANDANEARHGQLMTGVTDLKTQVGGTYDQALGNLAGLGDSARTRIGENKTRASGAMEQNLISRGLGNTTVRGSMQRGIESDANRANLAVDEQVGRMQSGVLQNRAGAEQNLGRLEADSLLSRQDLGPNMDYYMQLLQQMSSSGMQF